MNDDPWRPRKVVIVGAGAVGSTFAYALAQSGLADEITLRDANHELAMGQVLDLAHGQPQKRALSNPRGASAASSALSRASPRRPFTAATTGITPTAATAQPRPSSAMLA